MSHALSAIVLPDHLTSALENRAYREGVLSLDDYALAEIQRPDPGAPNGDEDTALDAVCLYDTLLTDSRRFNLGRINSLGEVPVLAKRPAARDLRLDLIRSTTADPSGAEPTLLQLLWKLRDLDGGRDALSADDQAWLDLRDDASFEAQVMIRRDLDWYLLDAKRNFEGDEHGLKPDPFTRDDVSHLAAAAFLKRNMFWIVEHLDQWHVDGASNVHLDSSDMWDVPRVVRRSLQIFSRSLRFESYFRFLQDTFASLFESAFVSRALGVENAYQRAPVRPLDPDHVLRAAAATQVIRVRLADIAEYFPLPRCVEEAMETRSHPKVAAFRQALERWLTAVADGDALEARLRREVERANCDLRLLKRWKSLKDNPLYFGVKTGVSLIPLIGQVTTVVDAIDYFAERRIRARTAWMVAPRSRLD